MAAGTGPLLVILCGMPFSGKSTLARRIAGETGWALLETDAIARALGHAPGTTMARADWAATYRESYRQAASHLAAGRSVVHDATNFRRMMRDRLRVLAVPLGARAAIAVVDAPIGTILARRAANRLAPSRPDVPSADLDDVRARFECPANDEPWLRWDPDADLTAWLARLDAVASDQLPAGWAPGAASRSR